METGTIGGAQTGATLSLGESGTTITAAWPAGTGLGPYSLLYYVDGGSYYVGNGASLPYAVGYLNGAGTTYSATLTNLLPGTQYDFSLWTELSSPNATPCSFTDKNIKTDGIAPGTLPAAPGKIMSVIKTGKLTSNNSVALAWINTSNNETGFTIERQCTTGSSPDGWTTIGSVGADVTTYTDTGMAPGNYNYRISAVNAAGSSPTVVAVGVWPPGVGLGFDGSGDTAASKTIVRHFYTDYVLNAVGTLYPNEAFYFQGVAGDINPFGAPLLITDSQLNGQLNEALSTIEPLDQKAYYRASVPFDIVAYSRGNFAALAFAQIVTTRGIPDDQRKATASYTTFEPGLDIFPHLFVLHRGLPQEYFAEKPIVRFMGMVSPVGQTGILSEFGSVGSWGKIQLNPGWSTAVPSGAWTYEAKYNDPLEEGVLPQVTLQTSENIYVAQGDTHVTMGRDPNVENSLWKSANAQNVPISPIPSQNYRNG